MLASILITNYVNIGPVATANILAPTFKQHYSYGCTYCITQNKN